MSRRQTLCLSSSQAQLASQAQCSCLWLHPHAAQSGPRAASGKAGFAQTSVTPAQVLQEWCPGPPQGRWGRDGALCVCCLGDCVLTHLRIPGSHPDCPALGWPGSSSLLLGSGDSSRLPWEAWKEGAEPPRWSVTGPRGLVGTAAVSFFSADALALVTNGFDGPTGWGCQLAGGQACVLGDHLPLLAQGQEPSIHPSIDWLSTPPWVRPCSRR